MCSGPGWLIVILSHGYQKVSLEASFWGHPTLTLLKGSLPILNSPTVIYTCIVSFEYQRTFKKHSKTRLRMAGGWLCHYLTYEISCAYFSAGHFLDIVLNYFWLVKSCHGFSKIRVSLSFCYLSTENIVEPCEWFCGESGKHVLNY